MGACNMGGSVIDWVMKTRGRELPQCGRAAEADILSLAAGPRPRGAEGDAVKLASPMAPDADDQQMLRQVVGYYHETLKDSPEALRYLERAASTHPEMLAHFQLGFANRTLGYRLPAKNRQGGSGDAGPSADGWASLRETGHEHFNGSLVVPIFSLEGEVLGMYGRKITPNLREGTPLHLYLPGPHRGVWNEGRWRHRKRSSCAKR